MEKYKLLLYKHAILPSVIAYPAALIQLQSTGVNKLLFSAVWLSLVFLYFLHLHFLTINENSFKLKTIKRKLNKKLISLLIALNAVALGFALYDYHSYFSFTDGLFFVDIVLYSNVGALIAVFIGIDQLINNINMLNELENQVNKRFGRNTLDAKSNKKAD
jgi:hypothetical protein